MNKLKRSSSDRVIAGVCGGFGEYFNIDPVLIRIGFIVLAFFQGSFILAYILCSIIIPEDDGIIYQDSEDNYSKDNTSLFLGGGLIVLGGLMLGRIIFPWFNFRLRSLFKYWPALLIVLGVYILFNEKNKQ